LPLAGSAVPLNKRVTSTGEGKERLRRPRAALHQTKTSCPPSVPGTIMNESHSAYAKLGAALGVHPAKVRQATSSFGRYQEELSVTRRWQGSFRRCQLTLMPCSLSEFSHPSFVGLQLAIHQLAIMARDDSETKPYIGKRLGFSQ
jgi:hypothetical protein